MPALDPCEHDTAPVQITYDLTVQQAAVASRVLDEATAAGAAVFLRTVPRIMGGMTDAEVIVIDQSAGTLTGTRIEPDGMALPFIVANLS